MVITISDIFPLCWNFVFHKMTYGNLKFKQNGKQEKRVTLNWVEFGKW